MRQTLVDFALSLAVALSLLIVGGLILLVLHTLVLHTEEQPPEAHTFEEIDNLEVFVGGGKAIGLQEASSYGEAWDLIAKRLSPVVGGWDCRRHRRARGYICTQKQLRSWVIELGSIHFLALQIHRGDLNYGGMVSYHIESGTYSMWWDGSMDGVAGHELCHAVVKASGLKGRPWFPNSDAEEGLCDMVSGTLQEKGFRSQYARAFERLMARDRARMEALAFSIHRKVIEIQEAMGLDEWSAAPPSL